MLSAGRRIRPTWVVFAVTILAATWVAIAGDSADSVASPGQSKSHRSPTNNNDDFEEEQYHWVVTRDGELARSRFDVDDPDELSRYDEFDVTVKERRRRRKRKRASSRDDVIKPIRQSSVARTRKLTGDF